MGAIQQQQRRRLVQNQTKFSLPHCINIIKTCIDDAFGVNDLVLLEMALLVRLASMPTKPFASTKPRN